MHILYIHSTTAVYRLLPWPSVLRCFLCLPSRIEPYLCCSWWCHGVAKFGYFGRNTTPPLRLPWSETRVSINVNICIHILYIHSPRVPQFGATVTPPWIAQVQLNSARQVQTTAQHRRLTQEAAVSLSYEWLTEYRDVGHGTTSHHFRVQSLWACRGITLDKKNWWSNIWWSIHDSDLIIPIFRKQSYPTNVGPSGKSHVVISTSNASAGTRKRNLNLLRSSW